MYLYKHIHACGSLLNVLFPPLDYELAEKVSTVPFAPFNTYLLNSIMCQFLDWVLQGLFR